MTDDPCDEWPVLQFFGLWAPIGLNAGLIAFDGPSWDVLVLDREYRFEPYDNAHILDAVSYAFENVELRSPRSVGDHHRFNSGYQGRQARRR